MTDEVDWVDDDEGVSDRGDMVLMVNGVKRGGVTFVGADSDKHTAYALDKEGHCFWAEDFDMELHPDLLPLIEHTVWSHDCPKEVHEHYHGKGTYLQGEHVCEHEWDEVRGKNDAEQ